MNQCKPSILLCVSLLISGCANTWEARTPDPNTGQFSAHRVITAKEISISERSLCSKKDMRFVVVSAGKSINDTPFSSYLVDSLVRTEKFKRVYSASEYFDLLVNDKKVDPYKMHYLSADAIDAAYSAYGCFVILLVDYDYEKPLVGSAPSGGVVVDVLMGKYDYVARIEAIESQQAATRFKAGMDYFNSSANSTEDTILVLVDGFLAWYDTSVPE